MFTFYHSKSLLNHHLGDLFLLFQAFYENPSFFLIAQETVKCYFSTRCRLNPTMSNSPISVCHRFLLRLSWSEIKSGSNFIATSHHLGPQNVAFWKGNPLFQGNLGWWTRPIWPDQVNLPLLIWFWLPSLNQVSKTKNHCIWHLKCGQNGCFFFLSKWAMKKTTSWSFRVFLEDEQLPSYVGIIA